MRAVVIEKYGGPEQLPTFQIIVDRAPQGIYRAEPARVLRFEEIQEGTDSWSQTS